MRTQFASDHGRCRRAVRGDRFLPLAHGFPLQEAVRRLRCSRKVFSDTYDDSSIEHGLKASSGALGASSSVLRRLKAAAFPWRLSPQRAGTMPSDMAPALWLEELEAHLERL